MKYRYLLIRKDKLKNNLIIRNETTLKTRFFSIKKDF